MNKNIQGDFKICIRVPLMKDDFNYNDYKIQDLTLKHDKWNGFCKCYKPRRLPKISQEQIGNYTVNNEK